MLKCALSPSRQGDRCTHSTHFPPEVRCKIVAKELECHCSCQQITLNARKLATQVLGMTRWCTTTHKRWSSVQDCTTCAQLVELMRNFENPNQKQRYVAKASAPQVCCGVHICGYFLLVMQWAEVVNSYTLKDRYQQAGKQQMIMAERHLSTHN